jgi:hypothetical protein
MLPPKFKTVKQPEGSKICAAAVAAMVVGEDLEYAVARMTPLYFKDDPNDPWYPTRELLGFIGKHGIHPGLIFNVNHPELLAVEEKVTYEFTLKGMPAIIIVPSTKFTGYEHYIFWDGCVVRDPNPNIPDECDLNSYLPNQIIPLIYVDEQEFEK